MSSLLPQDAILPGSTIGILGGGQLGRMLAIAAANLGYRTHIFAPEADSPAAQLANHFTCADYTDKTALKAFANAVDVVTLEFENVPTDTLHYLAQYVPTRPGAHVLARTQHRLQEKTFLHTLGIPTAPFASVHTPEDAHNALAHIGTPALLKTCRDGYDGKGQARINHVEDAERAYASINPQQSPSVELILEGFVPFVHEISVIVARNPHGQIRCFPIARNIHAQHILRESHVPADIAPSTEQAAIALAERIAEAIDLEGLLAVELFLLEDGSLLVNELAPRPHNSGHWSLDGCITSQFTQAIRAACNLPLGDVSLIARTIMQNLLGSEAEDYTELLHRPGARLHLYGKSQAAPGRKMGHITELKPLD